MMKHLSILLICLLPAGAFAVEPKKTFEVASVKPSGPPGGRGGEMRIMMGSRFGPGTADPTRWVCDNCPVSLLMMQAYNLKRFQISGPAWIDNERFDISARVAEGATKDDLRLMQKSLLEDRFGMKARLESKEMQVFDLVVGKNGHKLKTSTTAPPDPSAPPTLPKGIGGGPMQMKMGADGFPDLPKDRTMTFVMNGNAKHQAVAEDMTQFVNFLSAEFDKPVTDSTGLTGKYDYTLTYAAIAGRGPMGGGGGGGGGMMMVMRTGPGPGGPGPGAGPGGGDHNPAEGVEVEQAPPLQKAVQDQLGLRLDAKKGNADFLTIDSIEKVPTEN